MIKPGKKSPGGTFDQINRNGRKTGETAKVPRGRKMPPTDRKGHSWKKISSGKRKK